MPGDEIEADDLRRVLQAVKAALDEHDTRICAADLQRFEDRSAGAAQSRSA